MILSITVNKALSSFLFLLLLSIFSLMLKASLIPAAGLLTPLSMTTAATSYYSINSSSLNSSLLSEITLNHNIYN